MKTKTSVTYHFKPTKMTKVQKGQIINVGEDVAKFEPSNLAGGTEKQCRHWKTVWQFLKKLNWVTHDPAILLQGIHPKTKIHVHTKACTWICTAALLIILKKWKQSNYPLIYKWISKIQYAEKQEYFSAIKINEVLYATMWMDLKNIMLSKTNQSQETTYCKILLFFWPLQAAFQALPSFLHQGLNPSHVSESTKS